MKSSLPQCLHSKSSSLGCVDLATKSREYPNKGCCLRDTAMARLESLAPSGLRALSAACRAHQADPIAANHRTLYIGRIIWQCCLADPLANNARSPFLWCHNRRIPFNCRGDIYLRDGGVSNGSFLLGGGRIPAFDPSGPNCRPQFEGVLRPAMEPHCKCVAPQVLLLAAGASAPSRPWTFLCLSCQRRVTRMACNGSSRRIRSLYNGNILLSPRCVNLGRRPPSRSRLAGSFGAGMDAYHLACNITVDYLSISSHC